MTSPKDVTKMARAEDSEMDLGHGHSFASVLDQNERLVGWLHTHPDARDAARTCQAFCAVRPGFAPEVYEIEIVGPLTLTPALACRICGVRGHVREGKWVPFQG